MSASFNDTFTAALKAELAALAPQWQVLMSDDPQTDAVRGASRMRCVCAGEGVCVCVASVWFDRVCFVCVVGDTAC